MNIPDILQDETFWYAFLALLVTSVACGTIGVLVVLRKLSFFGEALSHSILPGIVIATIMGISIWWGAIVAAAVTVALVALVCGKRGLNDHHVREDSALGILFTAMFAAGILLLSTQQNIRLLSHTLFGNVLLVSNQSLSIMAIVALAVLLFVIVFRKELELTSFDPTYARVIGISPERLRLVLFILIAATVIAASQVVGVLLTTAFLVTPAACALLLVRSFPKALLLSPLLAIVGSAAGLLVSFSGNLAPSATVVLTLTGLFFLIFIAMTRTKFGARS